MGGREEGGRQGRQQGWRRERKKSFFQLLKGLRVRERVKESIHYKQLKCTPKKSSKKVKEKTTHSRYSKENLTFHHHQLVVLHPGCISEYLNPLEIFSKKKKPPMFGVRPRHWQLSATLQVISLCSQK